MLRCWTEKCNNLIVAPEMGGTVDPRAGDSRPLAPQVRTLEVTCGRCGTRYMLTAAKKPGYAKVERAPEVTEDRRESKRGWE